MGMQLIAIIEKDKHGFYAYCPQLKGCQSEGKTLEAAMKNIKEAIALYLEVMNPREKRALKNRVVFTTPIAA